MPSPELEMSASWCNDDNHDRLFWTIFGTLLVFYVALDSLVGDGDVSHVRLIESIAISVLPAGIYWGIGRRGRAAVYAAIQRAGWARAEASFQRLQEALKTRPLLWWSVVIAGRATVAMSLLAVSLFVAKWSESNGAFSSVSSWLSCTSSSADARYAGYGA